MGMFDKEAVHEESVGKTGRANQNHRETVVSKVRKVRSADDFIDT